MRRFDACHGGSVVGDVHCRSNERVQHDIASIVNDRYAAAKRNKLRRQTMKSKKGARKHSGCSSRTNAYIDARESQNLVAAGGRWEFVLHSDYGHLHLRRGVIYI